MLSRAELLNAFKEIDTDGSGSIEMGELANLCAKVNVTDLDTTKVAELFQEIDTNHDGKVSFEEFTAWYRLGRNSKLRDVLKYKIKAMQKFDAHFTKKYKKASAYDGEGRTSLVDIEIRDGEPSEDKNDCYIRVTSKADEELSDRVGRACPDLTVRLGEGHDSMLPPGTRAFVCYTMRSTNPEALAQAFRDFYNAMKDLLCEQAPELEGLFSMIKYHVGTDEDWVVVASDAAGNPFLEQFVFMGLQGVELADMAQPEFVMRGTTDSTFDSLRTAEDFKNQVDNSRFKLELSCDTAGREGLLQVGQNFAQGGGDFGSALTVATLFKGFKFKAKANSKEQSGSFNDNFQKAMEEMQLQVNSPYMTDAHRMMSHANDLQFKNWEACLQYFRDNKDHQNLAEPKKALEEYPFVRDLLDAFRTHAVADYNLSVFFQDCQLTMAAKNRGTATMFNEAWEALGELRD